MLTGDRKLRLSRKKSDFSPRISISMWHPGTKCPKLPILTFIPFLFIVLKIELIPKIPIFCILFYFAVFFILT